MFFFHFLSFIVCTTVSTKTHFHEFIYISPETGNIIGSWNVQPLFNSIKSLELLTDRTRLHKTLFASTHIPGIQTGTINDKLIMWLTDHIDVSLEHVKSRLANLGFTPTSSRQKRAPLAFIGHLQSAIFGTIDEHQFQRLTNYVQSNFKIFLNESSQVRGLIADDRRALLETLKVVENNSKLIMALNSGYYKMQNQTLIFSRIFQCSFAINAIERVVLMLEAVKISADMNMISRTIIPPATLRAHILKLSDQITGQSPIFNSGSISLYYKLKLSVATVTSHEIIQLVSVPMISVLDKYTLSHATCHDAHVCLESDLGIVTLPVTDYLRCHGVTSTDTPTVCPFRACISSHFAVCRMINTTTAIVSTSREFTVLLNCNNHFDKKILIANITIIKVPTHCSINGPDLKIRPVKTMIAKSDSYSLVFVPFQITENDLILNTTFVDPVVLPHLAAKGIRDLLSSKIRPSAASFGEFSEFDIKKHGHMSIAAISTSSIMIVIFVGLLILACVMWKMSTS